MTTCGGSAKYPIISLSSELIESAFGVNEDKKKYTETTNAVIKCSQCNYKTDKKDYM